MSQVAIHRPEKQPAVPEKPFFTEVANALEAIKNRAFGLFEGRGRTHGLDLDDWFNAERDLFWVPKAEMTETDTEFRMEIDVQGFENTNINVSALPGEIVVKADYEKSDKNEFESKSLYRRFEMGAFDPDKVTASVNKGVLTIVASKMAAKPEIVPKPVPVVTEKPATEAPAEKKTEGAAVAAA